jgi:endonuclease IV
MKFGVKTYDSEKFLDKFLDKCDFFEVQSIRGKDYSFLSKYDKEIIIHCEHQGFGINIADVKNLNDSIDSVEFAKKIADFVGAKKIIIHPGHIENENCSIENSINFLKKYCDKRFIIENMPLMGPKDENIRIGSSIDDMKLLLEKTKLGFCFDINHAIEYSLKAGINYWELIRDFEKLKPKHYHLGGEKFPEGESHINFCNSNLDLKKVFSLISKNAEITLEVGLDEKEVEKDLVIVNDLN